MTLPRANRLRRREDFSRVYQKGIRRRGKYLSLVALRHRRSINPSLKGEALAIVPADSAQPSQIGVSVSQKVSKRAVIRNRIRRQIKAAFYQLLPAFSCGWKLIIVVHPSALQCDYFQFLRELEQLLMDAEVLNGHS